MSINHPKQKQIRLPFSVPKPGRSLAPSKRTCGICRRNESEYTCPRCNVPYCSLACFKDQGHVQCSEPFYKSTVLDQIAADPKADFDEKKRMLDMLRRFEDSQAEGDDSLKALEEDEESEDELERALAGVDLDDVDSNKLFHLLPQQHRDAFLAAIRDPESAEAKALLALESERAEDGIPDVLPWWEGDELDDEDDDMQIATRPSMLESSLITSISPPAGTGLKLVFNALAITLAYLHTLLSLRLPSLDDRYLKEGKISNADVKGEVEALVPFLSDQMSTVRYGSIREAWEAAWGRIGETMDNKPSSDVLLRLVSILSLLLRPSIMADSPSPVVLALSDLYRLYANPKPGAAVPRKLVFYLACLKLLSRDNWLALQRETERELAKLQEELSEDEVVEETGDRPTLRLE